MTGRPTDYSEATAAEICDWLANGNSLRTYCAIEGNPGYSTVMQWLKRAEGFAESYALAREAQGHNDADQVAQVRQMVIDGLIEPDAARVVTDSLKWTAARRLPKVYGDKLQVGGDADGAPISVAWAKD